MSIVQHSGKQTYQSLKVHKIVLEISALESYPTFQHARKNASNLRKAHVTRDSIGPGCNKIIVCLKGVPKFKTSVRMTT